MQYHAGNSGDVSDKISVQTGESDARRIQPLSNI